MRTESDKVPIKTTTHKYDCKGTHTGTQTNATAGQRESYYFSRDPVRINPKDQFGFRPPSPYKSEFRRMDYTGYQSSAYSTKNCPQGTALEFVSEGNCWYAGSWMFDQVPGYRSSSQTTQLIKQRALSDLKQQKVNLAMTLAFSRETAGMVSQGGRRLLGAYKALKGRDPVHALRELGAWRGNKAHKANAASLYLEALFGWGNLANDILGAVEHMNKQSKPAFSYVYGRSSSDDSYDVSTSLRDATDGWNGLGRSRFVGTARTENKAVCIGRITSEGLHNLASLGFSNPAEVLWDILPWSWVINQFVAVSEYLSTYDATVGLTYLGGAHTLYQSVDGDFSLTNMPPDKRGRYVQASGHIGVQRRRAVRTVFDADDVNLTIRNPFKTSTTVAAAVAAALVNGLAEGPFEGYKRLNFR